jgi:hypothetical protein
MDYTVPASRESIWGIINGGEVNIPTINCQPENNFLGHIQSMMYDVDKIGLDVIKDMPSDCLENNIQTGDIIDE